jgi:hypothetical protein
VRVYALDGDRSAKPGTKVMLETCGMDRLECSVLLLDTHGLDSPQR